jgi:hypothetical protein
MELACSVSISFRCSQRSGRTQSHIIPACTSVLISYESRTVRSASRWTTAGYKARARTVQRDALLTTWLLYKNGEGIFTNETVLCF